MTESITRRQFVAAGVCVGLGVAATGMSGCAARTGDDSEVDTPSTSYGGSNMAKRVLVGYATRTGSTTGVAQAIGETLAKRGFAVDVKPLRENPSLAGYDAVVLGSAINGGKWLPEADAFVKSKRAELGAIPVAAFCVHIMNAGDDAKATRKRHAYLDALRQVVQPVDEGYFMGKGPSAEDTALVMRWAFRAFGGDGEGDCRDWDAIRTWAESARI